MTDFLEIPMYRGLVGKVFSRGLDKYQVMYYPQQGFVYPYTAAKGVYKDVVRRAKKSETPLNLLPIGHSLGAREAIQQANKLSKVPNVIVRGCILLDYVTGCGLHKVKGDFPCLHLHTDDLRVRLVPGANNVLYPGISHIELDDDEKVWQHMNRFIDNIKKGMQDEFLRREAEGTAE